MESIEFVHELHDLLVDAYHRMGNEKFALPHEWLEALVSWAEGLLDQRLFLLTKETLALASETHLSRYPGIRQKHIATRLKLDILLGDSKNIEAAALDFALRPYLLPDREKRPVIYKRVMPALLRSGRVREYRLLLWNGIFEFYTDEKLRFWFLKQVKNTYKSHVAVLLFAEAPLSSRLAFLVHLLWLKSAQSRVLRLFQINNISRLAALGFSYWLNYHYPRQSHRLSFLQPAKNSRMILVTRAMGGLGDILMMTPGLRALRKKNPQATIHFAIPKAFFPLLGKQCRFRDYRYRTQKS